MSSYYTHGCRVALIKLGMEAGPAPYASTDVRDSTFADNKKQLLWKNMDDEAFMTGEESGIGMPSPSKEASENDGGYGDPSGPYGAGAYDANTDKVDRDQRNSDSVARGFETNRLLDQSYGPEAAITQPHGPKLAFPTGLNAKAGISGAANMGRNMGALPKLPSPMGVKGIGQNARAGTMHTSVNSRAPLANQAISSAGSKSMTPAPTAGSVGNISGSASISPSIGMPSISPPAAPSASRITSGM